MSTILAVDTSTVVAVGLAAGGGIVASARIEDSRAHAEELMPLVVRVLDEAGIALADIDGLVAGVGPGPFTGLRVGVVTATTLAEVLGVPVRGACSLDAIAAAWASAGAPQEFVVASDARRKEVYWARYEASGRRLDGPHVTAPAEVPALPLAGPGAALIGDVAGPQALDAGWLAAAELPDAGLEPLYLRRPDAEVSTKIKSTLPAPKLSLRRTR
ncbi:MAG: tRNA (adenosine(37)-N6)-threonylcarbamoyltransferase complex dimerization subunit type 1 TsaB [Propioniciclava sp.]|uniref:tRNA (adenosine(37)-N6)-threonylcarbamoyltransferase complex dimerization subunit type 1 TsaB n=1 Tax=Propioniciclava sp. TaxID=2038686 RepID=UPI0039E41535